MSRKDFNKVLAGTILILLLPLIAMQFSDQVVWTLFDFVVAGVVLMVFGSLLTYLVGKAQSSGRKLAVGIAVLVLFLLTWAELAVGLFGSPWAGS